MKMDLNKSLLTSRSWKGLDNTNIKNKDVSDSQKGFFSKKVKQSKKSQDNKMLRHSLLNYDYFFGLSYILKTRKNQEITQQNNNCFFFPLIDELNSKPEYELVHKIPYMNLEFKIQLDDSSDKYFLYYSIRSLSFKKGYDFYSIDFKSIIDFLKKY